MTIKSSTPKRRQASGMTLIEVTVLLVLLLVLLGMTFIGVRAWKKGADRTACIMNIYQTQKAVRSFANMNGLSPGTDAGALQNPIDVKSQLLGENGYIQSEPECPGSGTYQFGGNMIPRTGKLYLSCSLASTGEHVPGSYDSW